MLKRTNQDSINRIIDANINRAKEGLRVCEEIVRFVLESRQLSARLKKIRHKITFLAESLGSQDDLLKGRASLKDVGRAILAGELRREGLRDIFSANMQRVKESVRVLEEFSKLKNTKTALGFKAIRYKIYETEKNVLKRNLK